jgi:hypothetical protein
MIILLQGILLSVESGGTWPENGDSEWPTILADEMAERDESGGLAH